MSDFTYIARDDEIHQFIFHVAKRIQVDEFIGKFDEILLQRPSYLLIYIDSVEGGLPPMKYTMEKLRTLFKTHHPLPKIYAAYLYDSSIMGMLISMLDTLRSGAKRKLFKGNEAELAIQWLHEQKERELSL